MTQTTRWIYTEAVKGISGAAHHLRAGATATALISMRIKGLGSSFTATVVRVGPVRIPEGGQHTDATFMVLARRHRTGTGIEVLIIDAVELRIVSHIREEACDVHHVRQVRPYTHSALQSDS